MSAVSAVKPPLPIPFFLPLRPETRVTRVGVCLDSMAAAGFSSVLIVLIGARV